MLMKKILLLLTMMLAEWNVGAKADHTLALDLSGASTNNVTYSTETNVATFTKTYGSVYFPRTVKGNRLGE